MRPQAQRTSVVDMLLIHRWAVRSVQGSRRNAMVASTDLTRRRVERDEVEAFLAHRTGRRTAKRPEARGAVTATR